MTPKHESSAARSRRAAGIAYVSDMQTRSFALRARFSENRRIKMQLEAKRGIGGGRALR